MIDDPYKILGLDKDATEAEINAAYRNLARTTHPDGGGSTEEFDEIKQAHLILLDPEKRRKFDRDGIVDGNNPDNITSTAMQRITMFFVQSVQATLNAPNNLGLDQLDLIKGGTAFFNLEIKNCQNRINETEKQIRQFEKVLKRLKTRRESDVISVMLNHHVAVLRNSILAQKHEIAVYDEAKLIIGDYTFDLDQGTWLGGFIR